MKTLSSISDMRAVSRALRAGGQLAFVPTMGALHEGHRACIRKARERGDAVVVSIFLNPTQFAPGEDLDRYPSSIENDLRMCDEEGCEVVFVPAGTSIYPSPQTVWVEPGPLADPLCGRGRPGHFRGVCTVVAKLFGIVQPNIAVFGQKDAQQALVIRSMVRELDMDVDLALCPTVRENDGLAVSSRNAYLSPAERQRAPALYNGLRDALAAVSAGERDPRRVCEVVRASAESGGFDAVDYVELRALPGLGDVKEVRGHCLLAAAAFLGATRLIDNVVFELAGERVSERLLF